MQSATIVPKATATPTRAENSGPSVELLRFALAHLAYEAQQGAQTRDVFEDSEAIDWLDFEAARAVVDAPLDHQGIAHALLRFAREVGLHTVGDLAVAELVEGFARGRIGVIGHEVETLEKLETSPASHILVLSLFAFCEPRNDTTISWAVFHGFRELLDADDCEERRAEAHRLVAELRAALAAEVVRANRAAA